MQGRVDTFDPNEITIATLIKLARDDGFEPYPKREEPPPPSEEPDVPEPSSAQRTSNHSEGAGDPLAGPPAKSFPGLSLGDIKRRPLKDPLRRVPA